MHLSKYYSPIDIKKYQYEISKDIRDFMDRPLNPQELKEFIPGYSDIKDIASKSLDVVKAATDIGIKKDKDQAKKDKERKKDYKAYSEFLVNGFRDYEQQYFLHPILYINEEKRLIGYTVLSDTTNSWLTDEFITLQPYKLQNTDLYKLDKQKNHGKLQTIGQKVLGFPYKRCLFKKIEVDNISDSNSPASGKLGQQLTLPIYKALNKFNPVRGTKFYCDLVYYDESNRQLLIGKEIHIEQVTQKIVTISKIVKAKKEKEKDKIIQRKIDLSLLIPAYATELKLENPTEPEPVRENSLFSYTPIFPQSIEDGEEFYRSFKEKEEKGEKPKLVLFYIRPFLSVKELETERDSFSIDKSLFDFDYPIKNDHSSLRPFLLGKEDRYDLGGMDTRRRSNISKEDLEKFLIKHHTNIRLHGFDLRYLSESVSQKNTLREASLKDIIAKAPQYLFRQAVCPYQYEVSFKERSRDTYIFTVISKIVAPEGTKPITQIVVPFNTILQFVSNKKIQDKSYTLLIINEQVIERQSQGEDIEEVEDTVTAEEETPAESNPIPETPPVSPENEIQTTETSPPQSAITVVSSINEFITKMYNTSEEIKSLNLFDAIISINDNSEILASLVADERNKKVWNILYGLMYQDTKLNIVKEEVTKDNFINKVTSTPYLQEFTNAFVTSSSDLTSSTLFSNPTTGLSNVQFTNGKELKFDDILGIGVINNVIQYYISSEDQLGDIQSVTEESVPTIPPVDETTIPDSMEEILSQDEITSDTSSEEIETAIGETEDPRVKKNLEMFSKILEMVSNNSEIDIIELDETQIGDPSQFASRIESSDSIQDLANIVKNKYKGKISGYNPTSENESYFIVDSIEKVEFTSPSPAPSPQEQASPQQNANTPDISKAEGEIKYFKMMDEDNLNNSESVESDKKTAFFEGWKQGNSYYVRVNLKVGIKTLIERQSGFLTPIFDYKTNESATSIKNIEPAVFDISTGKLTKKGKLELI